MSVREYNYWAIGAIMSAFIWLIMILTQTVTILSALVGTAVGCFTFYYWIRIMPPNKNIRLVYVISSFVTLLVNKLLGIPWLLAIVISFTMMIAIMFIALYVCTMKCVSAKDNKSYIWYRNTLRRRHRR